MPAGRHRMPPPSRHVKSLAVPLRESATAVVDPEVESVVAAEAATPAPSRITITEASTGTMTASGRDRYWSRLIEGDRWGSSGYWSREVLERDGAKAFPMGSLSYLDHPTLTEEAERPERSVQDLAATIVSTPVYQGDGLYATVEVFPHVAPLIESLAGTIGLSIRGEGTGNVGTIAGRTGVIIESLDVGHSVDFVTRAGAGGKLISLLEAARGAHAPVRESRNIGAWLEARLHLDLTSYADDMYGSGYLTRPERIVLSQAIGDGLTAWTARVQADAPQLFTRDLYTSPPDADDPAADVSEAAVRRRVAEATSEDIRRALDSSVRAAYGNDSDTTQWVWVRDYDDTQHLVWFDVSDNEASHTWQQPYELTTGDAAPVATLTGDRVEVFPRTEYVPVEPGAAPGDTSGGATVGESAATPDVTPGAPPAVPNPPPTSEETGVSGTQNTGPEPGAAAGTTDTTVSTAVAEAQTARLAAETALAEANRKNAENEAKLARITAVEAARPIAVAALAESSLTAGWQARALTGLLAEVPLTEALALDEAKFKASVADAIRAEEAFVAAENEAAGAGRIQGLGGGISPAAAQADPQVQTSLAEGYIASGMSPEAAKLAAAGRP